MKRAWTLKIALLVGLRVAVAQELPSVLPLDVERVNAVLVNPALAPFAAQHAEFGVRERYLGITSSTLALTSGFATYAFGGRMQGMSVRAMHFSSRHLDRTRLGAGYGRVIRPSIALGLSADLVSLGYGNLDLLDADDPLFARGTSARSVSIGFGALLRPIPGLEVGMAVQDANRPDLALDPQASARLPAKIHAGVGFALFGQRLRLGLRDLEIGTSGAQGWRGVSIEGAIGARFGSWAGLEAIAGNRSIGLEGSLRVGPGIEARYRVDEPFNDLAKFSHGSHQLAVVLSSGHLAPAPPRLPAPSIPPPPLLFDPPIRDAHRRFFFLEPSTESATVAHLRIRRRVDPAPLLRLTPYLRDTVDELLDLSFPSHEFVPLRVTDPLAPLSGTYKLPYLRTIGDLSRLLSTDSGVRAAIIAAGGADRRAGSVWSTITGTGARFGDRLSVMAPAGSRTDMPTRHTLIPEREDRVQVDPPSLKIQVGARAMDAYAGPWSVLVRDASDSIVHRIDGDGRPSELVWDWRLASGELIAAANYTLALEWIDDTGQTETTRRHNLTVAARHQEIEIDVTALPRPAEGEVDRVILFIADDPDSEGSAAP